MISTTKSLLNQLKTQGESELYDLVKFVYRFERGAVTQGELFDAFFQRVKEGTAENFVQLGTVHFPEFLELLKPFVNQNSANGVVRHTAFRDDDDRESWKAKTLFGINLLRSALEKSQGE